MADNGGPAFPVFDDFHGSVVPGMSIRDYFAGQAMQATLTHLDDDADAIAIASALANVAYVIADAMLAARKEDK